MRRAMAALALLMAAPAIAEPLETVAATARFERDAADHRRQLSDLYMVRGLPAPSMEAATVDRIARFLQSIRQPSRYQPNSAVLFYAQSGNELAVYLIDRNGLMAADVSRVSADRLDRAALGFRLGIDVDGLTRTRAPVWRGGESDEPAPPPGRLPPADPEGERLGTILLPPAIRARIGEVRHLVIVGGGPVGTIPFAALRLNDGEQLVDRMTISVSAGLFDVDRMIQPWRGRSEFDSALIVGNPKVPESPDWQVADLPGAQREAVLLGEALGQPALVGTGATREAVSARMPDASMLYIAAHGVSNPRDPLRGGFLMLSGDTPDNAFLRAGEIQTQRLSASLAVLSACQSGLGMNHDGGVIGLARSFQKAGVPRVVMSLWSVADGPTLFMMTRFQHHVMEQIPAEALRLAMIETRAEFPEPALWASFALFGTPR